MKFGIALANLISPAAGYGVQGCLDIAQAADDLGFHSVGVGDHLLLPAEIGYDDSHRDRQGATRWQNDLLEPFTLLAAVAARTKQVRLSQGITIIPLRHPILLAKVGATIDCISGGRFVLGAGVGWMEEEFVQLGLPPGTFEHRGGVTNEYLAAIQELWTSDGPSSFSGKYVRFERVGAYPKPVQRPHPPIVVGGWSRPAMLRAIRFGNGWDCSADSPEQLAGRVGEFRALCAQQGRDPDAIEVSMNWLLRPGAHGLRLSERDDERPERPPLTGSPRQIVDDLRRFEQAGLQHLITLPRTVDGPRGESYIARVLRGIEVMAREIVPAFA